VTDGKWWLFGRLSVLGEVQEWDVLYDPEIDEG
jgi:hypothetical protein